MTLAFFIAVTGVVALVAAVIDAICMMRLRRLTGEQPALREIVGMALGTGQTEADVTRLARLALVARLASFAGIGVLIVLLVRL